MLATQPDLEPEAMHDDYLTFRVGSRAGAMDIMSHMHYVQSLNLELAWSVRIAELSRRSCPFANSAGLVRVLWKKEPSQYGVAGPRSCGGEGEFLSCSWQLSENLKSRLTMLKMQHQKRMVKAGSLTLKICLQMLLTQRARRRMRVVTFLMTWQASWEWATPTWLLCRHCKHQAPAVRAHQHPVTPTARPAVQRSLKPPLLILLALILLQRSKHNHVSREW